MMRKFSMQDRLRSVRFALSGIRTLLIQEHNARVHLVATITVIAAGYALGFSREEWVWVLIATALVWFSEAFNTSIERLGDAVTTEHHPQIGIAKDVAAAGVLVASICAALIGFIVLVPHFLQVWP
jgi:diacylglycerol kinase (ATP)